MPPKILTFIPQIKFVFHATQIWHLATTGILCQNVLLEKVFHKTIVFFPNSCLFINFYLNLLHKQLSERRVLKKEKETSTDKKKVPTKFMVPRNHHPKNKSLVEHGS